MTRRESRGLVVLIITLVALISGGITAYKDPDSCDPAVMREVFRTGDKDYTVEQGI